MKMRPFFIVLFLAVLIIGTDSYSQTPSVYELPGTYHFDYEVTQVFAGKKSAADSSVVHFFYSKSGDNVAARFSRNADTKGNLFVVLTRDGISSIFDERNKNITIISVRKLVSDLEGLTKWIRLDSVITYMRKKPDGKEFQSVNTGLTKRVGNYTSEEYALSDGKGRKGSVWCATVDFNTQGDYILGIVGASFLQMMSSRNAGNPLFHALTQPKVLVTEVATSDSVGVRRMQVQTVSINQVVTNIPTSGYTVNNYSNMTLSEIFHAEMKKRNN